MKKKYIISGMLGTLLLGFTTVFALNITNPTPTNPIFKAVYIGGSSAGTQCSGGKPSCVGTNSTICMDGCGGLYLNVNVAGSNTPRYSPYGYGYSANGVWGFGYEANNFGYSYGYNDAGVFGYGDGYRTKYNVENILKWNPTNKIVSVGKLLTEDLPDNIITATHILDRSVLTRKFNSENITLPTIGGMIKSNNTCGTNETAVGISGGNMVCVPVSFLNTQNFLPNCGSGGGSYSLFASGIQYVSGGQTVYGYRRACKSNVINVLGADGGDMNWSGSTTGNIGNKNIGNVGVGLTNPSQKLTVQDSLNVNGNGAQILCMRTNEYVDIDTYNEDYCAKCDAGYTYDVSTKMCKKGCSMCLGSDFTGAILCSGDNVSVPEGTNKTLVGNCLTANDAKCQYECKAPDYIYANGKCEACMAGTYNSGSNACVIKPNCATGYEAIQSGNVGICVALGNCYDGITWDADWHMTYVGISPAGPSYLLNYYNGAERIYVKEPSRPIGRNMIREIKSNSGSLEANKCQFACAEGYLPYNGSCQKPYCSYSTSKNSYPGVNALKIENLSGATKLGNAQTWMDASDYEDFKTKASSQIGCFYRCPNGLRYTNEYGEKICSPEPVVVDTETEMPSCNFDFSYPENSNNLLLHDNPIEYWQKSVYTGYTQFVNIEDNNLVGCYHTCKPPAIRPSNYGYCIPKCESYQYASNGWCYSCGQFGTVAGPLDPNGNNTKCEYDCPDNMIIDGYESYCLTCPIDTKPGVPVGNNYTRCVSKCLDNESYNIATNSCYTLNETAYTCPSGSDLKETSPGVFQCLYCLAGTTWDNTEKKCK